MEEIKYKVGQDAKVVANESKHQFEIGETVTIDSVLKENRGVICISQSKAYAFWLSLDEVEPITKNIQQ